MSYTTRGGAEIEYPEAYAQAIKDAIHGRANAKRWRLFAEAHPHLAAWIDGPAPVGTPAPDFDGEPQTTWSYPKHPLGSVPTFIRKACEEWGAPSERAVATLQRIFEERTANAAKRDEQRAAEAASAEAWQPGRQVIEGVVISVKSTPGFGYYAVDVWKMLVKRQDGSRVYVSIPSQLEGPAEALRGQRVRFTATVEPKAGEPTFAFAKRPAKAEILTPTPEA